MYDLNLGISTPWVLFYTLLGFLFLFGLTMVSKQSLNWTIMFSAFDGKHCFPDRLRPVPLTS